MQKQQRGMLEYSKLILEKVSFDAHLFEKELLKAVKQLLKEEVKELMKWCEIKFGDLFQKVKTQGHLELSYVCLN